MKGKRKGEAVGKHSNFPSHHQSFLLPNYPNTLLCYLVSSATTCGYVCLHKREKGTIRFFFCNFFFLFLKKTFGPDPPLRHRCGPFCVPPRKGEKRKGKKKKCRFIGGREGRSKGRSWTGQKLGKRNGRYQKPSHGGQEENIAFSFFPPFFSSLPSPPHTYLHGQVTSK